MPAMIIDEANSRNVEASVKLILLAGNPAQAEDAVIATVCERIYKEKITEDASALVNDCLKARESVAPQSELLAKTILEYFIWGKNVDSDLLNPIVQKVSESRELQKLLFDGYGLSKGAGLADAESNPKPWQLSLIDKGAYKLRLKMTVAQAYLRMGCTKEYFLIAIRSSPDRSIFTYAIRKKQFCSVADDLLLNYPSEFRDIRLKYMSESNGECLAEAPWLFDKNPRVGSGSLNPGYPEISFSEFKEIRTSKQLMSLAPSFNVVKWALSNERFDADDIAAYLNRPSVLQELDTKQQNEIIQMIYSPACKRLFGNESVRAVFNAWDVAEGKRRYLARVWKKANFEQY